MLLSLYRANKNRHTFVESRVTSLDNADATSLLSLITGFAKLNMKCCVFALCVRLLFAYVLLMLLALLCKARDELISVLDN